jgi:thiamine-phosphate pyrophosphorylase
MKLHALVSDLGTAKAAVEGGATVVQLRLKGLSTPDLVDEGRAYRHLCALHGVTFVVNDDYEAAVELGADGVHLGRGDPGADAALAAGLLVGTSAADRQQAIEGERIGATYVGAGPVWATPTKPDADPPIGLDGLAEICEAVSIPVIAIGGVDTTNATECLAAGAAGVAVVRAAADSRALRKAIDEALPAR